LFYTNNRPEGAATGQPRAKRSVALGLNQYSYQALKGRNSGPLSQGNPFCFALSGLPQGVIAYPGRHSACPGLVCFGPFRPTCVEQRGGWCGLGERQRIYPSRTVRKRACGWYALRLIKSAVWR